MKLRISLELNIFPSFVLVLFSKGKFKKMCILGAHCWSWAKLEAVRQRKIKGDWLQAISLLAGSKW